MKKLLLGIGSFAAAAAPVAAVVACGDDDNKNTSYTTSQTGVKAEFSAIGTKATIGANLSEDTTYSRFRLVADKDSAAVKLLFSTLGVTTWADLLTHTTKLDTLETFLRTHLTTNASKYGAPATAEGNMSAGNSGIVLGTFGADAPGATGDTYVQLGVNGFATKAATISFLKDAMNAATDGSDNKVILSTLLFGL